MIIPAQPQLGYKGSTSQGFLQLELSISGLMPLPCGQCFQAPGMARQRCNVL